MDRAALNRAQLKENQQYVAKFDVYKAHQCQIGAICSSAVRACAHGAMGRRIDPSWGGPIKLYLVPASATRLV